MIKYLKNNEIDKSKWDKCIEEADNSFIYAFSWYLDIVSPDWGALVKGDYETLMPVPNRSKFGIRYVYTPRYVQQLGVFGKNLDAQILADFISEIPSSFGLVEMNLNEDNADVYALYNVSGKTNYILDLDLSYSEIKKKYNRNCKRNITKAKKAGLTTGNALDPEQFAEFVKRHLEKQIRVLSSSDIALLEQITNECLIREKAEIACVQNQEGVTLAAGSFLHSGNRLIFSVCASSPEGKSKQAMYFLVNSQIEKYAGKYKYFDFSGSNIKGIAYFNSTFGAVKKDYPYVKMNRLNWLQKIASGKFR
jgi:hypothetical protein